MNILLWFAIMNGAAAWVPPRIKTTSLTPLAASRTLSEKLQDQVQGAALALTLLTSVTTALPTHAFSNDFAGVPVEAKKVQLCVSFLYIDRSRVCRRCETRMTHNICRR